jgi:serine phosphatase RsbU (regulator of sigma subunit)
MSVVQTCPCNARVEHAKLLSMPRLIITAGPLEGQEFSFADTVIVGRGVYSDVRLDDSTVSRRHAEIQRRDDGQWLLRDLGSANGTTHRGAPISGEILLDGTLEFLFGEVPVRIEMVSSAPAATISGRAFPQLLDRLTLLATIAALPAQRKDPLTLVGEALDLILSSFTFCQRASVYMRRVDGAELRARVSRDRSGNSPNQTSHAIAQICLRQVEGYAGDARRIADASAPDHPLGIFASPLILAGETLGVLLVEAEQADAWNPLDQPIAKAIGSVIAGLLDAERAARPERLVAERDLSLARRVQQHFLPQTPVAPSGYSLADSYAPARAVGGDHFDYFTFSDGRFGILIADVAGKAVSGALVMARLGMAARLVAPTADRPEKLLRELNAILIEELESGMFITAQALALNASSGELEVANAGHPAPILCNESGRVRQLEMEPGAALGIVTNASISIGTHLLQSGDALLLYSDGLDDAENADGEAFGRQRALFTLGQLAGDAATRLASLNRELAAFVGDASAADDLTLVMLTRDKQR